MLKLRIILPLLLSCWLLGLPGLAEDAIPEEKQATLAALSFLEQIDRSEYEQSWESCSQFFQAKTERDQWVQEINHLRPQYGENQQRQLQLVKPVEGSAETVQRPLLFLIFRSTFASKTAIEMVTMVKDPDQLWRVGGYSLQ